ncbi:MAG: LUD domain-containing protein [Chloroflexota bacterium]|nr:LUD domain-containing protein [Chloroflexota bacterium]
MMASSKEVILGRIAQEDLRQRSPADRGYPAVTRYHDHESYDLIETFTAALDRLEVTWEISESPAIARLGLMVALQEEGVQRVLSWDADQLPVSGLLEALDVLEIEAVVPDLRAIRDARPAVAARERRELIRDLESIPVGITGADAAIASTGTLVLASGPGRSSLVSEIPRRHVALVPVRLLHATMLDWVTQEDTIGICDRSNVTMITGPSMSLDIELIRTIGLFGPRLIHVILVHGT